MWKDSIGNIVVIFQPNILSIVGFNVRHSASMFYLSINLLSVLFFATKLHLRKMTLCTYLHIPIHVYILHLTLGDMAIPVVQFSGEGNKVFWLKINYSQMKLPNFENWSNGELSKIGHHFSNKHRVSVQGVESLWGDCRFIPADWGS